MSSTEKTDTQELIITILKEHEKQLCEINQVLENLSGKSKNENRVKNSRLSGGIVSEVKPETTNKSSILIVDDDSTFSGIFSVILDTVGYDLEVATTGWDAIIKAKKKDYSLILLDMILPDIRGDEVAKIIRKNESNSKIVILTGQTNLAVEMSEGQLDVNQVVLKPVDPKRLLNIMKDTLNESK